MPVAVTLTGRCDVLGGTGSPPAINVVEVAQEGVTPTAWVDPRCLTWPNGEPLDYRDLAWTYEGQL
jgi:hypothetical protein